VKKAIINFLKIVLPLGVGLYVIWSYFSSLDDGQMNDIIAAAKRVNFGWVLFSLVFALLSHWSRAKRWNYSLEHMGYTSKVTNNFFAVMIAYLVNLAIPRLGELSRCGVIAKYENIPFNKLLGTVVAERVADLILLLIMTGVVILIQLDIIQDILVRNLALLEDKFSMNTLIALGVMAALGFGSLLFLMFNKNIKHPIILKVRKFIGGIIEGLVAIVHMKTRWQFLFHTLFIWVMYVLMFYVCFFSLEEMTTVPFAGVLTAFVLGGFTVALTNGGIGLYPIAVMEVLLLYNIPESTGTAFGWIAWIAQTLLLIIAGIVSFILLPMYNKRKEEAVHG